MSRAPKRRRSGVTLVELMIAIVIIALASSGMTFAVGALARTKLRAGAMRIAAAARFARHRALTAGTVVRVVIDIDTSRISVEEAMGGTILAAPDREGGTSEDEAINPWEAAQALMAHPDAPALGASAFGPIVDGDGNVVTRLSERPLEGCTVVEFRTPHEPLPRDRGRVSFYYFPNGTGEHTYVVIKDARDNKLTIELTPLAARGVIHQGVLEHMNRRVPRDPG